MQNNPPPKTTEVLSARLVGQHVKANVKCNDGDECLLEREYGNPRDANAVVVNYCYFAFRFPLETVKKSLL